MKRLLSVCAVLPLFGCGQSFFIRVDLSLNAQGVEALAIDTGQLRELRVQAIPAPSSGLEPVSFSITNEDGSPILLSANQSYTLELPSALEGVPLTLVHEGLSADLNINTPLLFGESSVKAKSNRGSEVELSVHDPKCNGAPDLDEFCFSVSSSSLDVGLSHLLDVESSNADGPLVMMLDSGAVMRAFAVGAAGALLEDPSRSISLPGIAAVDGVALVASAGTDVTLALLASDQISVWTRAGAGPSLAAAGATAIASAELDGAGVRDLAYLSGSTVSAFLSDGAGGFAAPISRTLNASDGEPVLLGVRKPANGEQLGVVTRGSPHLSFLERNVNNALVSPFEAIPLPDGAEPVSVAFGDFDGDDIDDALILDNGVAKRLLLLFVNGNGSLKPGGLREIPLSGALASVAVGHFDDNASLDVVVSGLLTRHFVQFLLATEAAGVFRVTPPRTTGEDPRGLVSIRRAEASVDSLVVEAAGVSALDVFVPEE